ncbi:MAG: hypothetical protein JOZ99_13050 [Actinobacteria bacterium]|nr:hypothetical protein [Actinomycetota bacterium]
MPNTTEATTTVASICSSVLRPRSRRGRVTLPLLTFPSPEETPQIVYDRVLMTPQGVTRFQENSWTIHRPTGRRGGPWVRDLAQPPAPHGPVVEVEGPGSAVDVVVEVLEVDVGPGHCGCSTTAGAAVVGVGGTVVGLTSGAGPDGGLTGPGATGVVACVPEGADPRVTPTAVGRGEGATALTCAVVADVRLVGAGFVATVPGALGGGAGETALRRAGGCGGVVVDVSAPVLPAVAPPARGSRSADVYPSTDAAPSTRARAAAQPSAAYAT